MGSGAQGLSLVVWYLALGELDKGGGRCVGSGLVGFVYERHIVGKLLPMSKYQNTDNKRHGKYRSQGLSLHMVSLRALG